MREKVYCLLLMIIMFITVCCNNLTNTQINELIIESENQLTEGENQEIFDHQKKIALVMKTLTNPFFIDMENGARKAEEELGIKLIVKTGAKETSIDQQITIVQELIGKVDAIVIAPGSSELIPVLKEAQDAGIFIVNIDNRLDPELCKKCGLENVPFISVDNNKGAYLSAKFISDKIHFPTDAAILEGIRGATNAEDRKKGALRAFKENENIKEIVVETANWKIDEAYKVTEKLYQKNPNIGALFCANDMMALGTIRYLQEMGKKNVLVAGYDALNEAKNAISNGWLQVTVNQHADIQGYQGVRCAVRMINGEKVEMEKLVNADIVYLNNLP